MEGEREEGWPPFFTPSLFLTLLLLFLHCCCCYLRYRCCSLRIKRSAARFTPPLVSMACEALVLEAAAAYCAWQFLRHLDVSFGQNKTCNITIVKHSTDTHIHNSFREIGGERTKQRREKTKKERRRKMSFSTPSLTPSTVLLLFFILCTLKDFSGCLYQLCRELKRVRGNSALYRLCDESCKMWLINHFVVN